MCEQSIINVIFEQKVNVSVYIWSDIVNLKHSLS